MRTVIPFLLYFNYYLILKTVTPVLLHILQNMLCFWMIGYMKKANNFQIAEVQGQDVASVLLEFFSGSAYCYL